MAVICAARLCGASLRFSSRARISVPRCARGSSMRTCDANTARHGRTARPKLPIGRGWAPGATLGACRAPYLPLWPNLVGLRAFVSTWMRTPYRPLAASGPMPPAPPAMTRPPQPLSSGRAPRPLSTQRSSTRKSATWTDVDDGCGWCHATLEMRRGVHCRVRRTASIHQASISLSLHLSIHLSIYRHLEYLYLSIYPSIATLSKPFSMPPASSTSAPPASTASAARPIT